MSGIPTAPVDVGLITPDWAPCPSRRACQDPRKKFDDRRISGKDAAENSPGARILSEFQLAPRMWRFQLWAGSRVLQELRPITICA